MKVILLIITHNLLGQYILLLSLQQLQVGHFLPTYTHKNLLHLAKVLDIGVLFGIYASSLEQYLSPDAIQSLLVWFLFRLPIVDLVPRGCQRGFDKIILAMTITAEFEDAPVCHDLGVVSGGWEGMAFYVHPSRCHS